MDWMKIGQQIIHLGELKQHFTKVLLIFLQPWEMYDTDCGDVNITAFSRCSSRGVTRVAICLQKTNKYLIEILLEPTAMR